MIVYSAVLIIETFQKYYFKIKVAKLLIARGADVNKVNRYFRIISKRFQ